MGTLLIGTSGYDYPEWRDVFYPQNLKRDEYLEYYAEHFNALELNFSYYSLPREQQIGAMVRRSGGKVRFSVKGNKQFTHAVEAGLWRDSVREFRKALYPMQRDALLASVLLQFPQSFHYEEDTRVYLADLITEFSGIPLVVEFRHDSWQKPRVYDGLNERGVGYCMTDMPAISRLPQFRPAVTGGVGYMRFHGRNRRDWYGTNATDRYDYRYSDEELTAYEPVLRDIVSKTKLVQIYFNNHAKGNAAVNAKKLMIILAA
ncbi:DUF72 domain-containing protein [Breznakiella homolactica]|uniref:DUF72 domain-containing protein n=1 Tax=Breznakiella homolactica TaxID=2798577 RepID=A0A7T7XKW4_9SPIR|nr:DUF72 domain-containing protein [Breznakiella homolactica]QQO08295.1 DUF72 domain-containing protein [Breznakiella homolactica]